MMTELAQLQSELEYSAKSLRELDPIFNLVLEQFPEQAGEVWQQQVRWLIERLQDITEREQDMIHGLTLRLNRLQKAVSCEVSQ